jgi:hypothetical protein
VDRPKLRLLLKSIPLVTLTALAPACGDTVTDPAGEGELTEAEALALAGQLGLESLVFGRSQGAASAPSRTAGPLATQTVSLTYDLTRPCLLGGSVHSFGQISVEADEATELAVVDVTATDVHQGCVFLAGNTRVSVTGDPDVTTTIHAAALANEPLGTQSVSVEGGLAFTTDDGRSGRCDVDVLVEVNVADAVHTTRGHVCGFAFDVTVQGA